MLRKKQQAQTRHRRYFQTFRTTLFGKFQCFPRTDKDHESYLAGQPLWEDARTAIFSGTLTTLAGTRHCPKEKARL